MVFVVSTFIKDVLTEKGGKRRKEKEKERKRRKKKEINFETGTRGVKCGK